MVLEFMRFWRAMPDRWQSITMRRVGRRIIVELQKDAKLMRTLEEYEGKGLIKKVENNIEKAVKNNGKEFEQVFKIGEQVNVLELHETQRLGLVNLVLADALNKMKRQKTTDMKAYGKISDAIKSINGMITKMKDLEQLQAGKLDRLRTTEELWTRAWEMDEGSVLNEMKSIGTVEGRLVSRIKKVEKRTKNITYKIEKETKPERINKDIMVLQTEINLLGQMIEKEKLYFDEQVKDEIIFMVFLRNNLRKLEGRIKLDVTKGYPKETAEKLVGIIESAIAKEIKDIAGLVKEIRFEMSQAERQYAKAA